VCAHLLERARALLRVGVEEVPRVGVRLGSGNSWGWPRVDTILEGFWSWFICNSSWDNELRKRVSGLRRK
jgi:hypothetical protein